MIFAITDSRLSPHTRRAQVDNHIHLSAAMTSVHLLSFIRRKMTHNASDIVALDSAGQATVTLGAKCVEHKLSPQTISVGAVKLTLGIASMLTNLMLKYPFQYHSSCTVFSPCPDCKLFILFKIIAPMRDIQNAPQICSTRAAAAACFIGSITSTRPTRRLARTMCVCSIHVIFPIPPLFLV